MKSIHKRIKIKQKYIVFFALVSVCFVTALYARFIRPLFSHASGEFQYMSAVITDDNGEVDFSPDIQDAVADFSYSKTGNHIASSNIYDVKIILNNLPVDIEQKKLSVTLPVGMVWVDDASHDLNLLAQLDSAKGTNGIEAIALDQEAVLGYNFDSSGTRIYNIIDGSVALTLNLKVRVDSNVNLGYIQDAIVARVEVGNSSEEAHLDVNVPGGASIGGMFASANPTIYVGAGSTYTLNKDYLRTARPCYVNTASAYLVPRLITQIKFSMHVEGKAVMQLNTTDTQFTFDDSDSSNGNYVFTYNPTVATDGVLGIPYALIFSDELTEGETVVVTGVGETSYWQPDGSTLTLAFRNSQTATFVTLPTDSDGVTVGWNTLSPSNEGSAHDINVNSPVRESERMTGILGHGYVNNRGATDSVVKKAKMTFDTDVLGVMLVRLPCSPNGTIESVHIKTASGIEKDVTVNLACNSYGISSRVSYVDFGTERDDYLAEIEYVLGIIPAATQLRASVNNDGSRAFVFMGKRLDETQPGIATIEIFDADDPEKTTGIAKITSNVSTDAAGLQISKAATQVKNAGEALQFSITASAYGTTSVGYSYGTKTPIIYLRSEVKDASGNYLPISNIKVVNEDGRGKEDITSKFGQIVMRETEHGKVYVLDGRNVTDGSASLASNQVSNDGALSYGQLVVTFSIETDFSTPSQSYDIANMFFIQDPEDSSISTTSGIAGDPFGISEVEGGGMIRAASTNYYQVRGAASVGTENSGQHTASDTWLTWTEGSNPITIGSVGGSAADMRISLLNNSGVDITSQVVVYSPIPKKNEDWGTLSYAEQPFEFSTKLTGAISNPNSEYFTIAYGRNVTPSDNGNDLNDEGDKFTVDTTGWTASDWEEVNCIRVTTTFIPANQPDVVDRYDFLYHLEVVGVGLDSSSDGSVNTWRPLFFQQLTNSIGDLFAGWYKGSYVSIKLANGTVYGEIFVDANENGKKDSDEQALREAGWKIDLYDRVSNRLVQSTETNANGQYGFIELAADADGYYMIVTNKSPIGENGVTYLFTRKGEASNTGSYNTDNQAEGDKTSSPIHATAYVGPVTPSQTIGEATYNIGVVEYMEALSFSGSVSFDDQNNRFGTRPANVTITANASDGSQQSVNVNVLTDNNVSFVASLPKYNTTGERLSYAFSSSDFANYDKAEQATTNAYDVTFTQKSATLRVHHYKKGTTDKLIPDDVSTVYWGQSYETTQGRVNSDYEFDSVVGATSGTVSGDIVVTYYYKKKKGVVTTHYYIKDSVTPISDDDVHEYEYGETYMTHALEEIPATFANYELVSEQPSGYTGIVRSANIEVTYYYQEKDPQINSSISIVGPETIDDKHATVPYSVEYSAHVVDYIGEAKVTIVLQLPYAIIEDNSDLDGGVYDVDNETITWTNELIYNTYTDGEDIAFNYDVELVFDGASADDMLVVTAEASIELSNKSNDAAVSVRTLVRTPARLIFKYVDEEGNEIKDSDIEEGFVGDECEHEASDIPGYNYIEDDEIDFIFEEEERTIYYRYEKVIAPAAPDTSNPHKVSLFLTDTGTFDPTIFVYMFVSSFVALVSLGIVRMSRRKSGSR